jgi:PAS domain S-box-containing protein
MRLPSTSGLRTRLALILGALGAVTAIGLSQMAGRIGADSIEADQHALLAANAVDMAARLARDLSLRGEQIAFAAGRPPMRDPSASVADKREVLQAVRSAFPGYAWIGLTDGKGRIVAATGDLLVGQDVAHRDWFREGSKGLYIGDVHEAVLLAKLMPDLAAADRPLRFVDVAVPVTDLQGRTLGVVAAHLSLSWAREVRHHMLDRPSAEGIELSVLDRAGEVLIGQSPWPAASAPAQRRMLQALKPGAVHTEVSPGPDGAEHLLAVARDGAGGAAAALGWTVVAARPKAEAFAPAVALNRLVLAVGLAMSVLFAGLLWWVLGRELRPLEQISAAARRIRAGEPGVPVPTPAGSGEVAVFARSLSDLVSHLQARDAELRVTHRIFEASIEAIVVCAPDGTVQRVNPAFERITGHPPGEVVGLPVDTLLPAAPTSDANAPADEAQDPDERVLRHPSGRTVVVSTAWHELFDEHGQLANRILVLEDITEHKRNFEELARHRYRLEELLSGRTADLVRANAELSEARHVADRASQAKSAFLTNMSHEIRTPLNAILGLAHLLQRQGGGAELQRQLHGIERAGEHLLGIVNDVLDLSKIDAGKLQIDVQDIVVADLVDTVRGLVAEAATAKGLSLRVEVRTPPVLRGDRLRLQQILLNFAGNAVKFTAHGMVCLRAGVASWQGNRPLLRFEVEDTGRGLTPEQQQRLFEPFEQADLATAREYGGTGLGLAISRRLCELMGGRIGVTSRHGHGSCFWIELALPVSDRSPEAVRLEATGSGDVEERLRRRGGRVLLAEDNPVNQEVARSLLEGVGIEVDVARNGHEAVEMARSGRHELILMDMRMPVMDGLQATREIRAMPGGASLPILAMTANAFDDSSRECIAAGMNDHIGKPVVPADLFEALWRWLPAPEATRRDADGLRDRASATT